MTSASLFTSRNLQSAISNLKSKVQNRKSKTSSPRRLYLESLEDRLALSGFGPEDGSYIIEPRIGIYNDVAIQPTDQAIMVVGGLPATLGVARYDSQGSLDSNYGVGGFATPVLGRAERGNSLVLQPDGKAVIAGDMSATGWGSFGVAVARLNTNGSPDTSFAGSGWAGVNIQPGTDTAVAVGLQSSGKIVLAGESNSTTNSSTNNQSALVARFTAAGNLDTGSGGFGQLAGSGKNATPIGYRLTSFGVKYEKWNDLVVQPDNKIVTAGYFYAADGSGRLAVARYTADGALDKTFNRSGTAWIAPTGISTLAATAVALQADGKVVVAGNSSGVDGAADMFVARFTATGALDTTFGGGKGYARLDIDGTASATHEQANDLVIQADGKIVLVGNEYAAVPEATGSVLVARLNADGTPDTTFAPAGFKLGTPLPGAGYTYAFSSGSAAALQSDGSIIVAGYYDTGPSDSASSRSPLLMRFSGENNAPAAAQSTAANDAALLWLLADESAAPKKRK